MMNRSVYTGLTYLLAPIAVARLYYLKRKHPGYADNIGQRFGHLSREQIIGKPLWLHAVSVGEVIASEPFVKGLLESHAELSICVTTTTPTGAEQVARSFSQYIGNESSRVFHSYAPYDLPGAVNRFLDKLNPFGIVIMETELCTNWISQLKTRSLPMILVNGRLSEKSQRGYAKLGGLTKEMLEKMSCISAQTQQDAERFAALGASRVEVTGTLKADFELDDAVKEQSLDLAKLIDTNDANKIMVAASTHPGEDDIVIEAFKQLSNTDKALRLILVPRHPDRCTSIGELLDKAGLGYQLRSREQALSNDCPVLLADQLGELRALYGLGKTALIGGTFVDHGGHNPLEPAAWGNALIAGPSQRNFDQAFSALERCGAMRRVAPEAEKLADCIKELLGHTELIEQAGQAAANYLSENRGATKRNINLFNELFIAESDC